MSECPVHQHKPSPGSVLYSLGLASMQKARFSVWRSGFPVVVGTSLGVERGVRGGLW